VEKNSAWGLLKLLDIGELAHLFCMLCVDRCEAILLTSKSGGVGSEAARSKAGCSDGEENTGSGWGGDLDGKGSAWELLPLLDIGLARRL